MTAYAGTSMTGTLYRYYACNRARKKLCDKKRVNKQKIEDFVIYKIVELLKDGELLDRLAELLYSLQYKESTILPRLEEELCQKEKEIERIVDAIQKGISSDALMKRLAMLEEQKKVVEDSIEEEKEKSPVFTKDQFCMALYNFRKIDVNTQEGKRKLIDTFVNSIFLYDDRLKIVFNGGAKNEEISLSELESSYSIQAGQPKKRSTQTEYFSFFMHFEAHTLNRTKCASKVTRLRKGIFCGEVWIANRRALNACRSSFPLAGAAVLL